MALSNVLSNVKQLIADLEYEYDQNEWFLGLLRNGHFDSLGRERLLKLLGSIDLGSAEVIDKRLVGLLWYMPLLMQWQGRRLDDDERKSLHEAVNAVTTQLKRVLGVPRSIGARLRLTGCTSPPSFPLASNYHYPWRLGVRDQGRSGCPVRDPFSG